MDDKERSALHTQVGGDHYSKLGEYQPWEVLARWLTPEELKGFMKGTVISYLAREADKGGMQDIKKAAHHMQIYLEMVGRAPKSGEDVPEFPCLHEWQVFPSAPRWDGGWLAKCTRCGAEEWRK